MYRPDVGAHFGPLDDAGSFCHRSFAGCNHEYRHSGSADHARANLPQGLADVLQYRRSTPVDQTCPVDPQRVVRKPPRPRTPPASAWANRPQEDPTVTAT